MCYHGVAIEKAEVSMKTYQNLLQPITNSKENCKGCYWYPVLRPIKLSKLFLKITVFPKNVVT